MYLAAVLTVVSICGCVTVKNDDPTPPEVNSVPEIRQARETKDTLQREARELKEIGDGLDAITSRISEHRIAVGSGSVDTVIKALIQTTSALRQSAQDILERGPQYIAKIDTFAGTLNSAPAVFAQAAALFRTYADQEPYAEVADDYRQVATMFDNLASRTQNSSGTVQKRYDREKLLQTLQFIKHQERFLSRLEAALYAQDFALSEIESLIRDIDAHARKFEELRSQIRDLNAAFRNVEAVAATQRLSPEPRPADVPSQTHEPSKVDDNPPAEKPAVAPVSYVPPRALVLPVRDFNKPAPAASGAFRWEPAVGDITRQVAVNCDREATEIPTILRKVTYPRPARQLTQEELTIPPELEEIGRRAAAAARGCR